MKVEAIVGVCIGVGHSLLPGECADVDKATAQFLVGINKVRLVPEVEAAPAQATPQPEIKAGKKAGKKKE
jgi:hypothetical protein